jgi:acyl dehydratase
MEQTSDTLSSGRPRTPRTREELQDLVGTELGPTGWHEVTHAQVCAFAEVTGDRQWIHLDQDLAARGQLGTTIAHGLLTLSLGPALLSELLSFDGFSASLNYGYDRVRFPAPLPVGARVRMRATILQLSERGPALHVHHRQTFEREGGDRPVAVADSLAHLLPLPLGEAATAESS